MFRPALPLPICALEAEHILVQWTPSYQELEHLHPSDGNSGEELGRLPVAEMSCPVECNLGYLGAAVIACNTDSGIFVLRDRTSTTPSTSYPMTRQASTTTRRAKRSPLYHHDGPYGPTWRRSSTVPRSSTIPNTTHPGQCARGDDHVYDQVQGARRRQGQG